MGADGTRPRPPAPAPAEVGQLDVDCYPDKMVLNSGMSDSCPQHRGPVAQRSGNQSPRDAESVPGSAPTAGPGSPVQDLPQELQKLGSPLHVERGIVLTWQGQSSDHLYLVLSGRFRRYHAEPSGGTTFSAIIGPGEFVNLASTILGTPETAFTQSAVRSSCLAIPRHDFARCLEQRPELALVALEHLARQSERRELAHTVVNEGDARTRVATFLCCHARGDKIVIGCSHGEAAESLCLRQETLSRTLTTLQDDGIIERLGPRRWRIKDADRLHAGTWCCIESQDRTSEVCQAMCRLKPLAITGEQQNEEAPAQRG